MVCIGSTLYREWLVFILVEYSAQHHAMRSLEDVRPFSAFFGHHLGLVK